MCQRRGTLDVELTPSHLESGDQPLFLLGASFCSAYGEKVSPTPSPVEPWNYSSLEQQFLLTSKFSLLVHFQVLLHTLPQHHSHVHFKSSEAPPASSPSRKQVGRRVPQQVSTPMPRRGAPGVPSRMERWFPAA